MRRAPILALLSVSFLLSLAASPAGAATVVHFEIRDLGGASPTVEQGRVTVDGQRLRMDLGTGTPPKSSMIFHGDRRVMLAVDHAHESYFEIDGETFSGIAETMSAAMKQMEQALAQLPPEQREMAEKMMKQRMPAPEAKTAPTSTTEIRPTSERAERQGYPSRKVNVVKDGEVIRELWVADWSVLGVSEDDFAVLEQMGAFLEEALSSLRDTVPMAGLEAPETFKELSKLGGVPVEAIEYENGEAVGEMTLRSIDKQAVGASAFEPPEGYRKQSLGM